MEEDGLHLVAGPWNGRPSKQLLRFLELHPPAGPRYSNFFKIFVSWQRKLDLDSPSLPMSLHIGAQGPLSDQYLCPDFVVARKIGML
jgi:hypothetical protein